MWAKVLTSLLLISMNLCFIDVWFTHKFYMSFLSYPQVIKNNYEKVIVFEDDLRFEPFFKRKMQQLMQEAQTYQSNWDLM